MLGEAAELTSLAAGADVNSAALWSGFCVGSGWLEYGWDCTDSGGGAVGGSIFCSSSFSFFLPFLIFQLAYFRLNLGLEFIRGPLELVQRLANLAGDTRQLLGPEQEQSQHKQY